MHPTTSDSKASGAERKAGGRGVKETHFGGWTLAGLIYLYHRVLQLSAPQLKNGYACKQRGQTSALSVFPGTYCRCSKGARRPGQGVAGRGTGEEASSGRQTPSECCRKKTKPSHVHACIQTDTNDICNTVQDSPVHLATVTTHTA